MPDLVGDTSYLTATTTDFNITVVLSGKTGAGHLRLLTAKGLKELVVARASVELLTETLKFQLVSGVTADKSYQLAVGLMPDNPEVLPLAELPQTDSDILLYTGSVAIQRSELANPLLSTKLPSGVTRVLKPKVLGEDPPLLVYHFTSEGTTDQSRAILRISGAVRASGFGFVKLH